MIQNNFNVSTIMNDSELGGFHSINGDDVKGDCVIGGGDGRENYGTSANSSSYAESI